MVVFPTKKELMDSIIKILEGKKSMTTADIDRAVADLLCLTEEQLSMESTNCSGSEYSYRMRWARTELKQRHLITNPKRGEWTIL
jgi:restriction endonuclease Mrr